MFKFHAEKSEKKLDCHYCDNSFDTMNLLMKHGNESHIEKVKPCIFASEGMCTYGELCWFNHDIAGSDIFQETGSFNCRICKKEFKIRREIMNHRKHNHSENVPMGRNFLDGSWFLLV